MFSKNRRLWGEGNQLLLEDFLSRFHERIQHKSTLFVTSFDRYALCLAPSEI